MVCEICERIDKKSRQTNRQTDRQKRCSQYLTYLPWSVMTLNIYYARHLAEASTHKSAKTHTGSVTVTDDLQL